MTRRIEWLPLPKVQAKLRYWGRELINPGLIPYTNREIGEEILHLVKEINRRPMVRKAPRQALPITDERRRRLQSIAILSPEEGYQAIGEREGVNGGRVSEAVAGKRK